jgi:hypothetical protein
VIEISTDCRACGRSFNPSHADYVRGTWRVCTACRDGPASAGMRSHEDESQTLSGPNNASKVSTNEQKKDVAP